MNNLTEKQRKINAAIAGLRKSHSTKNISYEQFCKRFDWVEAKAKEWGCEVGLETYNPLASFSTEELLAELEARGVK